ncbi:retinoblastoma-related protein isoform X2 [Fagus crenata]
MEDTKPLDETVNYSHSDSTNLDPSEARFAEFCKNGLSMDENTCTQAMKLFKETKHLLQTNISAIGNGTLDEAERFWFAFVLYSIKRLSEKNGDSEQQGSDDNGFTLCQILRAAKLNIVDFFKELPQFVVKAGPILCNLYGADWENRPEVLV